MLKVLSDWIIDGRPSIDVSRIDVARFLELHANQQYLSERIPEVACQYFCLFGKYCMG